MINVQVVPYKDTFLNLVSVYAKTILNVLTVSSQQAHYQIAFNAKKDINLIRWECVALTQAQVVQEVIAAQKITLYLELNAEVIQPIAFILIAMMVIFVNYVLMDMS